MAGRNGYFQIIMKGGKTYIRLVPPVDGGEPILLNELRDYLAFNKFAMDPVVLSKELAGLEEPKELLLASVEGFPVNEYFELFLADDKMSVTVRFYPPSDGDNKKGASLSQNEIVNDLQHRGIKAGIDVAAIAAYLKDRHFCTDYVLAKGQDPVQGKDAKIEYLFNTDRSLRPTLNEDGTVDFFNLNIISKCSAGDVLARLTKEVKGEAGINVLGEKVLPREVKIKRHKFGKDIQLSEDELTITSLVNGHVSLVDDKVFVSDVYEVVDVDTSTGNIDYVGDVKVTGNVKAGFELKVRGNIEIAGVVEGAIVRATGNISIARGVNGMGKGIIESGGNVVARFVENANITAAGYVHAEAIMNSTVQANENVTVTGKKGFIIGSKIRALGIVEAKTIGSEMGGDTEIEVGTDPMLKQQVNNLYSLIVDTKKNIDKLEPVLATFAKKIKEGAQLTAEQIKYFKQLSEQYKIEKNKYDDAVRQHDMLSEQIASQPANSAVLVSGVLYGGTMLTINEVSKVIQKPAQHSRFVRDGADIRIKAL